MSMETLNSFWVLEGLLMAVIALGLLTILFDKDKED